MASRPAARFSRRAALTSIASDGGGAGGRCGGPAAGIPRRRRGSASPARPRRAAPAAPATIPATAIRGTSRCIGPPTVLLMVHLPDGYGTRSVAGMVRAAFRSQPEALPVGLLEVEAKAG